MQKQRDGNIRLYAQCASGSSLQSSFHRVDIKDPFDWMLGIQQQKPPEKTSKSKPLALKNYTQYSLSYVLENQYNRKAEFFYRKKNSF